MRRRILTVALSAVVLAVSLLGVPLAVAIGHNAVAEERGALERSALRAAVEVSTTYRSGDPVELPPSDAAVRVALYDVSGRRVSGSGPALLEVGARAARNGGVVDASNDSEILEAVPVSVGEQVIGIVRASAARSEVRHTVVGQLLALAGLAALALLGAGALAFWQARRLTVPMRALAAAATDLGSGDFTIDPAPSGVREIDQTGEALTATAALLADQLARERSFAAQASHQLRTPLTRLRLELEAGLEAGPVAGGVEGTAEGGARLDRAVREALATADHLSQTIDDVLALARQPSAAGHSFDVEDLLGECATQWRGLLATADRPLRLRVAGPLRVSASRAAVRQVLQVLIDNAYRHGQGTVTLTARPTTGAVAVDVADRGPAMTSWPAATESPGRLGLEMARSLAAAQAGRLILTGDSTGTVVTLLLPPG